MGQQQNCCCKTKGVVLGDKKGGNMLQKLCTTKWEYSFLRCKKVYKALIHIADKR